MFHTFEANRPQRRKSNEKLCKSSRLLRVPLSAVNLQKGVDSISQPFHLGDVLQLADGCFEDGKEKRVLKLPQNHFNFFPFLLTRIKKHNRPQTAQLRPIHGHFPHFSDQFVQHPIHDISNARLLGIRPTDQSAIGQKKGVSSGHRSVAELRNQQLIPARFEEGNLILKRQMGTKVGHMTKPPKKEFHLASGGLGVRGNLLKEKNYNLAHLKIPSIFHYLTNPHFDLLLRLENLLNGQLEKGISSSITSINRG